VMPNGPGAQAFLSGQFQETITLDGNATVGSLQLDSIRNGFTITQGSGGSLIIDNGGSTALINVTNNGSQTIAAPLVLNSDTRFTVAQANSELFVTGSFITNNHNIIKDGAGAVQFENIRAGGLTVSAGTLKISPKGTPNSPSGTSVVTSLSLTGGTTDLTNNSLIVDYAAGGGSLDNSIRSALHSGLLISSSADAKHGLGYGDNGALAFTTFAGQPVDSTSMLVKYTYLGDANLDGVVDVRDLLALARHYHSTANWVGGDFNYDGTVDINDLKLLAANWNAGSSVASPQLAPLLASLGLPDVSVPKPTAMMIPLALFGLARRKRK
jgi:hypothetical protein